MAVRKKAGEAKAAQAKPEAAEDTKGEKEEKESTPSAASTARYQVPKDARKPRENSIIEAIYKRIQPDFHEEDCKFDGVATGAEICDAVADKLAKPKGEDGVTYNRSDVLSTLRWLVTKERIIKVEEAE